MLRAALYQTARALGIVLEEPELGLELVLMAQLLPHATTFRGMPDVAAI